MSVYSTLLDEIAKNIVPTILLPALVIISNIIYQYFLSERLNLRKAKNFWIKTTLRHNRFINECIRQFEDTIDLGAGYFLLQIFGIYLAFFSFIFASVLIQNLVNTNIPLIYAGVFVIIPSTIITILDRSIKNLGNKREKILSKCKIILNMNVFIWWFTSSYLFIWIILNFNMLISQTKSLQDYQLNIVSILVFTMAIWALSLSYSEKKYLHSYLQNFLNRKYHDNFPNIAIKTDVGEFKGKIGSIFLTDLILLLSINREQFIRWDSIKTISILTDDTVKKEGN